MAESHLVYKLEGDVKEVDVFKLAPTLLALGELIQESNRQVFPEGRDIGVNVKPFREGSFIIDLTLFSPSNLQAILDFVTPHSLDQLKTLLEVIGLIATGTGTVVVGAIQAIKLLKGKPQSIEEISPREIRYTANDGNSITVAPEVHALLSNQQITQNIYNIYGRPMLDQPEVSEIKTYLEGEEAATAMVVKRDELPTIREFSNPSSPAEEQETVSETIHYGVFLNPKRGAFGNDPKDWSFYRGSDVITATIKDKGFLANYASGEVRLNQSDLLTVDLRERQRVKRDVGSKTAVRDHYSHEVREGL